MTDLTTLVLPAWAVPSRPRRAAIDEHAIHVREQWWRDAISARGLPGTPPAGPTLTRADVWAPTDEVFTLLWRTLAWGSGRYLRQNARRLDSIAADVPCAENLLARAVEESRRDPAGAYAMLRPGGRNEIRSLGPSFFTKFPVRRALPRHRALEELSRCYHDVGHWLVYQRIHTPGRRCRRIRYLGWDVFALRPIAGEPHREHSRIKGEKQGH
jgi:hypothetical protein